MKEAAGTLFSSEYGDIDSNSEDMNHWPCPCAFPLLVSPKYLKHITAGSLKSEGTGRNARELDLHLSSAWFTCRKEVIVGFVGLDALIFYRNDFAGSGIKYKNRQTDFFSLMV